MYTSTSTVTTGTGAKTFTTQTNLEEFLVPNSDVYIFETADPTTNNMTGTVTSYDRLTGVLVVNVTSKTGTAEKSAWTISSNRWVKSSGLTAQPW
jgi:hypothetical protein